MSFVAGIFTSLTPCIFPMLPITIGVIGAKNSKSKLQSFSLAITYVLGIAITYATLGVIAGFTGSLFGSTLQNPYVVSLISLIFFLMGLSMFDIFMVQVPFSLQNKLSKIYSSQSKGNYLGVALMGLISGLIATPCVGPVIVTMLTYISQTKNAFLGFWLLFTFALGMGLILILLGTFSNLLTNLPKAGNWMETIKKTLGILMMLVSFYYIKPILPIYIFTLILGVFLVILSNFIGMSIKLDNSSSNTEKFSKGIGVLTLITGLFLFVNALASKELLGTNFSLVESTKEDSIQKKINDKIKWEKSESNGLKQAKEENKLVLIDFYADWCPSCIELDKYTYSNKEVISELNDFINIKIDATNVTPEIQALFVKYGVVGLPSVIFLDSNGNVFKDVILTGFEKPQDFIKRIKKIKSASVKDS